MDISNNIISCLIVQLLRNVKIGDNCLIGLGSVIMGPCSIGNNVKIGGNTVCNFDVADYKTVIGVKGHILMK